MMLCGKKQYMKPLISSCRDTKRKKQCVTSYTTREWEAPWSPGSCRSGTTAAPEPSPIVGQGGMTALVFSESDWARSGPCDVMCLTFRGRGNKFKKQRKSSQVKSSQAHGSSGTTHEKAKGGILGRGKRKHSEDEGSIAHLHCFMISTISRVSQLQPCQRT